MWANIRFLLIFFLLTFELLKAQEKSLGGLSFNSNDFVFEKRTCLELTSPRKIDFNKKLTLSFKIAFENYREYGYILRISSKLLKINLMYVQYSNKDTSYLQLVINNNSIKDKIALPKQFLHRGTWYNIDLILDKNNSEISLELNKSKKVKSSIKLDDVNTLDMTFGTSIENHDGEHDNPKMILSNIKIYADDQLIHYWPLEEVQGEIATDIVSNLKATVKNPQWIMKERFIFKKVNQVGPFSDKDKPSILYSKNREEIIIITQNFMFVYNLVNNTTKKIYFKKPLLHNQNSFLLDDKNDSLFAFYYGRGKISKYNYETNSWSYVDTTGEHETHYYGHLSFINPLDNGVYMINGYGWYKFHNDLQKYDFQTQKWNKKKLKGDFLTPRVNGAICKKNEQGDFLIFGGWGNKSGNQTDGTLQLRDLLLLNMRDTSIRKLREIENAPLNLKLGETMIYDSEYNQIFLVGTIKPLLEKSSKRLYRYDLTKNTFDCVSDSLFYYMDDNCSKIYLDKKYNQIYAFEKEIIAGDSFMVNIYSLNYPPITDKEFSALQKVEYSSFNKSKISIIIFAFVISTLAFGYFLLNRKKRKDLSNVDESEKEEIISNVNSVKSHRNNSIYLFGNFQVFNNDGQEITAKFTPKLKQLFILLLLKSYNGNSKGISTESLTTILWPELNNEQAKNNRNVNLSKLRGILSSLDKVEIYNEKNMFELSLSDSIYCDFVELKKLIDTKELTNEIISNINEITLRGEFLQEISYDWLEGLKLHFIENTIQVLKSIISNNKLDAKSKLLIADSILNLDSVNEDAMSIKINTLLEIGDHKTARNYFEYFKKEYYSLYSEEFPKSFKDFLN